jgi:hypothetical protein
MLLMALSRRAFVVISFAGFYLGTIEAYRGLELKDHQNDQESAGRSNRPLGVV